MKNKILIIIFIGYISFFSILSFLIPDKIISASERRKLKEFPEVEFSSSWIEKVEGYLLDHFFLREEFRSIKANYNYKVLNKFDNNDIYLKDNYIFKSNYPTNIDSIDYFNNNIKNISSFLSENNNVYMMVIPDKNYYLDSDDFLHIDYDYIYDKTSKFNFNYIDIRDILELEDYYETDTHWKQEKLNKVVKKMCKEMNFLYQDITYDESVLTTFYGVYYGESAVKRGSEKLIYLTNSLFDDVEVNYFENENINTVYNQDKLFGLDPYDVYLDGASSYIEINNKNASSDRELVIFRDSFGSSLTPLFINYYKKITLIDNRYINSDNFNKLIEFDDQDVLFMYSTLLINDSYSLKGQLYLFFYDRIRLRRDKMKYFNCIKGLGWCKKI